MNTYNSGNANDIEPVFVLPVDDIDGVEKCIKNACKKFQYRKYKEVYEINLDVLKDVLEKCESLVDSLTRHLIDKKHKKKFGKKIKTMKNSNNKYFAYVSK